MTSSLIFTLVFVAALVLSVLIKLWLASRQMRHVARHRNQVPALFADRISLAAHQKAADYTIAKTRFGLIELALATAVLLGWTLLGGLDALNGWLYSFMQVGLWQQLALVAAFALVGGLIELPVSYYQTFVLEQRFGFNKMTAALWLGDVLKGALLGALIGLPVVAAILWLMAAAGRWWWLWAWAVWMGFNLLLMVVYPRFIAPLFNQFKPLEDESLKARVTALMQRCGFSAQGLFVMDGSRRSAHANAYFTGFGSAKRVVFFDTLLQKLNADEVDAVLAHELGHFKHKHIVKRMVALFALTLAGFALLGWLSQQPMFYSSLGVRMVDSKYFGLPDANNALALLLFLLVMPLFSSFVSPLMAQSSRKHEFEADAYAVRQTRAQDLQSALLKLYEDNASTLTPDPLYVRYYYSHPPAVERISHMNTLQATAP